MLGRQLQRREPRRPPSTAWASAGHSVDPQVMMWVMMRQALVQGTQGTGQAGAGLSRRVVDNHGARCELGRGVWWGEEACPLGVIRKPIQGGFQRVLIFLVWRQLSRVHSTYSGPPILTQTLTPSHCRRPGGGSGAGRGRVPGASRPAFPSLQEVRFVRQRRGDHHDRPTDLQVGPGLRG